MKNQISELQLISGKVENSNQFKGVSGKSEVLNSKINFLEERNKKLEEQIALLLENNHQLGERNKDLSARFPKASENGAEGTRTSNIHRRRLSVASTLSTEGDESHTVEETTKPSSGSGRRASLVNIKVESEAVSTDNEHFLFI